VYFKVFCKHFIEEIYRFLYEEKNGFRYFRQAQSKNGTEGLFRVFAVVALTFRYINAVSETLQKAYSWLDECFSKHAVSILQACCIEAVSAKPQRNYGKTHGKSIIRGNLLTVLSFFYKKRCKCLVVRKRVATFALQFE